MSKSSRAQEGLRDLFPIAPVLFNPSSPKEVALHQQLDPKFLKTDLIPPTLSDPRMDVAGS